ncbi:MAG: hypothetical protein M1540_05655 [Candidatus Bathyarchaeota archaeon]|nr:hypothetical protein [Candidatus Bathyarchaeota archaeon]
MRKQTLTIGNEYGAEYQGQYIFSEITWAKRSRIIQKHTKYHPLSGQVQTSDFIAIQAETIWAALKEQPQNQPLTLETLLGEENGVPIALGELFSQVVNGLCALTREETAFLSEPSAAKNPTPPSPTFGSAKNSAGPQQNSPANPPESFTSTPLSSTK